MKSFPHYRHYFLFQRIRDRGLWMNQLMQGSKDTIKKATKTLCKMQVVLQPYPFL